MTQILRNQLFRTMKRGCIRVFGTWIEIKVFYSRHNTHLLIYVHGFRTDLYDSTRLDLVNRLNNGLRQLFEKSRFAVFILTTPSVLTFVNRPIVTLSLNVGPYQNFI